MYNCSQHNHSTEAIHVCCAEGYDGGLSQLFHLELFPKSGSEVVRNITRSSSCFSVARLESSVFCVTSKKGQLPFNFRLESASIFEARVYSSNLRGRSEAVVFKVSTLKRPSEKRLATIASGGAGGGKNMIARDF